MRREMYFIEQFNYNISNILNIKLKHKTMERSKRTFLAQVAAATKKIMVTKFCLSSN